VPGTSACVCLHLAKRASKLRPADTNAKVVEEITTGVEGGGEGDFERFFSDPDVQANAGTNHSDPADVFVIAVPTPIHEGQAADLRAVDAAPGRSFLFLMPGNLVVIESTIPPFTTDAGRPDLEQSDTGSR